ncbi:hypothetical protein ACVPOR_06500 [Staphylococcus aureus]
MILLPNQFVLIATGSSPAELPFLSFDHDKILSSDDILSLKTLPSSIGIIGGGSSDGICIIDDRFEVLSM